MAENPERGALMSASHALAPGGKETSFHFYDLDLEERFMVPMPLEFPHMAAGHPVSRQLVIVPESGGTRACVINLKEKRVVRELTAAEGRLFGGHASFHPSGLRFYCSEFEPVPSGKGFVSEWHGETFQLLATFPSAGRFPHDLVLSKDGSAIMVSNLGAETGPKVKSSGIHVSRIDVVSKKLLARTELLENPENVNARPLQPSESSLALEDLVMRGDASYFISFMQEVKPEFHKFVYAHSHKKAVTIWSVADRRLIREITFPEQPRALALLFKRTHIAVVFESGKIAFIDMKTNLPDRSLAARFALPVTTHVNTWWDYRRSSPAAPADSAAAYS